MDAEYFKKTKRAMSTPFHQDMMSIPAKGEHLAGFWISFEDQTPKEYALEVVKGSWRDPVYDNTLAFAGAKARAKSTTVPKPGMPRLPEVEELRKTMPNTYICSWDLKAGDVVCFHPNSLHGGGPVDPAKHPERNTLVFRFFGDDFVYRDSHLTATWLKAEGGRRGLAAEGDPYTKIRTGTGAGSGSWARRVRPRATKRPHRASSCEGAAAVASEPRTRSASACGPPRRVSWSSSGSVRRAVGGRTQLRRIRFLLYR